MFDKFIIIISALILGAWLTYKDSSCSHKTNRNPNVNASSSIHSNSENQPTNNFKYNPEIIKQIENENKRRAEEDQIRALEEERNRLMSRLDYLERQRNIAYTWNDEERERSLFEEERRLFDEVEKINAKLRKLTFGI